MAVPIWKMKNATQEELARVFNELPPASNQVKVEMEENGVKREEILDLTKGLNLERSLSFWKDNLPAIPETFTPGSESRTTPRRVLDDTVDVTGDVGQGFGAVGDVVGEGVK